jgi:hypothetical protein
MAEMRDPSEGGFGDHSDEPNVLLRGEDCRGSSPRLRTAAQTSSNGLKHLRRREWLDDFILRLKIDIRADFTHLVNF